MRSTLLVILTAVGVASDIPAADPTGRSNGATTAIKSFMAFGASADSEELVAVRFDEVDGRLVARIDQREPLGFEAAPVILDNHRLYVASLRAAAPQGNRLTVFDVKKGQLTRLKEVGMKHGSAYLSIDRTNRFLLGVSYFEGHADVYQLDKQGIPVKAAASVFEGRDKAHAIRTTRNNRFLYIPYVKDNNGLFQYSFDENTGQVRSLDPPQVKIPEGVGPRHVAFHPAKPFVFFSNEQQLGATSLRIGSKGQLKLISVCEPGSLKPADGLAASDIEITPNGRFLFVGVRDFAKSQFDAIHRYAVSDDGRLTHLGSISADAIPWGLQISSDHRHLLVTAAHGETLTAFRIDDDGGLQQAVSIKWGKMIRAIAVTALPDE